MKQFIEVIKAIESVNTIEELDACYIAGRDLIIAYDKLGRWEGVSDPDRMIATLNHLVIYHIMRIVNIEYDKYKASGRKDQTCIDNIARCYQSMKLHADNKEELKLLKDLCDNLNIN